MKNDIVELLYAALGSEYGLIVQCDEPARLRPLIYATRASLNDPELEHIAILTSPFNPEGEIIIFKKQHTAEADDAET